MFVLELPAAAVIDTAPSSDADDKQVVTLNATLLLFPETTNLAMSPLAPDEDEPLHLSTTPLLPAFAASVLNNRASDTPNTAPP